MAPRRPQGRGRSKIPIKRIEKKQARQVCFSKRRQGLFKKATQLAVKCGAKVAAVTFSPGGKAFSYGYPSVESVLDRFDLSPEAQALAGSVDAGDWNLAVERLNQKHGELLAGLEAVKVRTKAAGEAFAKPHTEGIKAAVWLDTYVSQMGVEDMLACAAVLEKEKAKVAVLADQVLQQVMLPPPPPGFAAGTEMMVEPVFAAAMMVPDHWFGPQGLPQ